MSNVDAIDCLVETRQLVTDRGLASYTSTHLTTHTPHVPIPSPCVPTPTPKVSTPLLWSDSSTNLK